MVTMPKQSNSQALLDDRREDNKTALKKTTIYANDQKKPHRQLTVRCAKAQSGGNM